MFCCGWCGVQAEICTHCDRGNRYCSKKCRLAARRKVLRTAGRNYQTTAKGRMANANRQRRSRERRRVARSAAEPSRENVTHPGSASRPPERPSPAHENTPTNPRSPRPVPAAPRCCAVCGARADFHRYDFLRRPCRATRRGPPERRCT